MRAVGSCRRPNIAASVAKANSTYAVLQIFKELSQIGAVSR
jgi:hypothetical protein